MDIKIKKSDTISHLDPRGRHPSGECDHDRLGPVIFHMVVTPCMTRAALIYIIIVVFFDRGTVKMLKNEYSHLLLHGVDDESEKRNHQIWDEMNQ